MDKTRVVHSDQAEKEKQKVIDGALATLVPGEELALREQKEKDLLGKISKSQELQKTLSKILEATGGLGFDWGNTLVQEILSKLGLTEKAQNTLYWFTWISLRSLTRALWKMKIYGEMFPDYGTGVVVGNHVSHVDPFLIGQAVSRKVIWMSKEENFQTPIIKSIFANYGAFPVKRGAHDEEAWVKGKEVLKKDWLGMFPEGTRSWDGTLGEFHTGSIRMAVEARVPIVPVVSAGVEKVLPKGALFFKIGPVISMMIGKPIYYEEYYDTELTYARLQELTDKLKGVMTEMLGELHEIHQLRDGTTLRETEKELSIGYPRVKE
jgi:1-acyl-sn-glycerol-3-phosphate acyltransferase